MLEKANPYIAVIGDIIDSKKIEDREVFQKQLAELFVALMAESTSRNGLCSPYTITLGDEFQALYKSAEGLFDHLFEIRARIYPVRCRFSIFMGAIDTEINMKQAIGMDGPAFHNARKGIEALKISGDTIALGGLERAASSLYQPALRLLWESTASWNANRMRILLRELNATNWEPPANWGIKISERAIYKNIKEAHLDDWVELIRKAEEQLNHLLELEKKRALR